MVSAKSIVYERKGEKDGFAQRFGKEIPDGTLIFMEGKEGTGKSVFAQRFCASILKMAIQVHMFLHSIQLKVSFVKQHQLVTMSENI